MDEQGARRPLPTTRDAALAEIAAIEKQISQLEQELIQDDDVEVPVEEPAVATAEDKRAVGATVSDVVGEVHDWLPPLKCVPICADVRTFDFKVCRFIGGQRWLVRGAPLACAVDTFTNPSARCSCGALADQTLGQTQREFTGRGFDVIMMDPPWQLATSNPTRGVRRLGQSPCLSSDLAVCTSPCG